MKWIFFFLIALVANTTFAQVPFEGMIKYSVRSSLVLHGSSVKNESFLLVWFGASKIKFQFIEPEKQIKAPSYTLIDLDSGLVYSVEPESATYIYHRLSEREPGADVPPTKTIAGYSTKSTSINEMDITGKLSNMLSSKTIFYVADNLSYSIPEKYSGNAELLMVQKGKIVLGSDFYFSFNTYNFQVDEKEETEINQSNFATIEAREVVAQKLDPAIFLLPANYKIRSRY